MAEGTLFGVFDTPCNVTAYIVQDTAVINDVISQAKLNIRALQKCVCIKKNLGFDQFIIFFEDFFDFQHCEIAISKETPDANDFFRFSELPRSSIIISALHLT